MPIIIAAVVAIIFIIGIAIFVIVSNNKKHVVESDNENQLEAALSENSMEQSSLSNSDNQIEENASADAIPTPTPKPVYHDLTLEEAWPIAQEYNVSMTVTSGTVNVRAKPTTESDKVGMVKENSVVYVICEEEASDGYTWCYVIYDKAAAGETKDQDGNTVFTVENKHYLGYIRKDLLQ